MDDCHFSGLSDRFFAPWSPRPRSRLAQSWGSPKTWPSLEGSHHKSVEQLGGVLRYLFNEFRHGFSISKWPQGAYHWIGVM